MAVICNCPNVAAIPKPIVVPIIFPAAETVPLKVAEVAETCPPKVAAETDTCPVKTAELTVILVAVRVLIVAVATETLDPRPAPNS